MKNYKMNNVFKNVKLTHIIAFDVVWDEFSLSRLETALNGTEYLNGSHPYYKPLSDVIYDFEFINDNRWSVLVVETKFSISKLIKEGVIREDNFPNHYKCNDLIKVFVTFDKCGIASVRLDFNVVIKKGIKTNELIETSSETNELSDRYLFEFIKSDLQDAGLIPYSPKETPYTLKEHKTYSIISSFNDVHINYEDSELLGISLMYGDYQLDKKKADEIISNNIPHHEGDILLVTFLSTLIIFFDTEIENSEYNIEERITAIEMFWRQKYLLKKLDFQVSALIKNINENIGSGDLKTAIKEIKESQISMHSELEVYRNTIISVADTFSMLFKTLNHVFNLENHYKFVQTKLETCSDIYEGLHDEQRNKLMENIQIILILLGLGSIFLILMTSDFLYSTTVALYIKLLVTIFASLFLLIPIIIYVYSKFYRRFY